jgi:hypothetical protein
VCDKNNADAPPMEAEAGRHVERDDAGRHGGFGFSLARRLLTDERLAGLAGD